jgi:NADPH:quinone reductase-like Zn-dependent oxidoreductase
LYYSLEKVTNSTDKLKLHTSAEMSLPSTFQGCEVHTPKAQLSLVRRALTALGPHEVGIKITATAINPVDHKMRDHDAFIEKYPAVLGSDAAGVVVATGADVKELSVGDRVFFQGIIGDYDSSTFQQYCKMPAELVAKTPQSITDEEAAGVMLATMAAVTAFYAEEGHGMTPPWEEGGRTAGRGKSVVIIGGASSVGQYAIQLARLSGYDRIITNASSSNHEFLKSIGAHVVLDRTESTPAAFSEATTDLPIDFVFDGISAPSTQKLGIQILQKAKDHKSHLVTVHVVVPDVPDPEAKSLGEKQEPLVEIKQVLGIGSLPALRPLSEALATYLGGEDGYIAQGQFSPNRPHVVDGGLHAIEEALSLNKSGVSGKKVIIRPHDTN